MTKELADSVKKIMSDMSFHSTWTLTKTLFDLYDEHRIIDPEIMAELNKRLEKQDFKKECKRAFPDAETTP